MNESPCFSFQTNLLHHSNKTEPTTGAVNVPIHLSSTFHQNKLDHFGEYDYSRSGNPTRKALEEQIALLENGYRGFAFSSGMAAISSTFLLFSQWDHIIISEDVYGGTYRVVTEVLNRLGIYHTFVDMTNLEEVKKAIRPNTKAFYIETPSNPLLKIIDIQAISQIAKEKNALTIVDNTFLTPLLQKPLDLGADIVLHSATKFLSGHSDVLAGLAVVKNPELADRLYFLQNSFGAVLGVQDCWLLLRGLKTLYVRLKQSTSSAEKLASYLESHPFIRKVFYPGLPSHPGYYLQKSQANGPGAVLSFELYNEEQIGDFIEHLKIPVFAVSLGAVESILSYPAKMSHASMCEEERNKRGISNKLLRLSVGIENVDDLIKDFEYAFNQCAVYS
ncbi:cystathionine beta-lyase [Peribacillus alkalitolerans]|uniref:cystathionine beta-lyase n=1 Tax=Peribacillus alkalitolerans TaxID=1550385 RepID=UPI0013D16573|nr:cystathionine beta-lyase [Peribacillus alkalitolerans]